MFTLMFTLVLEVLQELSKYGVVCAEIASPFAYYAQNFGGIQRTWYFENVGKCRRIG